MSYVHLAASLRLNWNILDRLQVGLLETFSLASLGLPHIHYIIIGHSPTIQLYLYLFNMLCHACQAMFDCETPSQEDMSPHHKTFATLYTAAASGCRICRKLWKVCERDPIQGTPISPLSQSEHDATEYRVFHEDPLKKDGLTIKMNALYPNGGAYGVFFKIIPTRGLTTRQLLCR